jgi:hypothetical protein
MNLGNRGQFMGMDEMDDMDEMDMAGMDGEDEQMMQEQYMAY